MPTVFNGFASSAGALLAGETSGLGIDFLASLPTLYSESSNTLMNYYGTPFTKDGGKIDFSRATLATTTDVDGNIKWSPHNLLLASEQFDASNWTKAFSTASANTVAAPNGTITADTIAEDTTTNVHAVSQSFAAVSTLTYSVYLKYNNLQYVTISLNNNAASTEWASAVFDIQNGTLASQNAATLSIVGTPTITAVGGGWYLCSISANLSAVANGQVYLAAANSSSGATFRGAQSYLGSSRSFYAWGAACYRSDLGGMQANGSAYPMYNPTTAKNLLGFTEDFSNAYWGKVNVLAFGSGSVVNAAIAPNGLQTADLAVPNTTSGTHLFQAGPAVVNGTPYVNSLYVKPAGYSKIGIRDNAAFNRFVTFNLTGGGSVISSGSSATGAITALSDGWYRIQMSATAGASTNSLTYYFLDNAYTSGDPLSYNYAGDGTSGIYLWGAQLSDSASLDPYVLNYGAAPTAAAYYGPRIDYDGANLGTAKGLLIEEQRTNFFLNSNAPTALTGVTVTAGAAVSPDGTSNAYRIAKTDATTPRYIQRFSSMTSVAGRTYTVSAWFKYDGYDTTVSLEYNLSTNWDVSWNAQFTVASTGVTTLSVAGCTSSVQNVGNGWYRVIATFTAGAAPTVTSNPSVLTRVTGASGVTVLGYGGQIEENASFATSYIPTAASTVTRATDVTTLGTSQFPYSETAGSWVVNFQTQVSGIVPSSSYMIGLNNDQNKRIAYISSGASAASSYDGVTILGTGEDVTGPVAKFASAYDATGRAVVSSGATVSTGTVAAGYSVGSFVNIASNSTSTPINGWMRQITYIPRRLTNTELQQKTVA